VQRWSCLTLEEYMILSISLIVILSIVVLSLF